MRKIRLFVTAALALVAATAHADGKKFLSCSATKDEVFAQIVGALSEKWTITAANDKLYLITATKEDVKGKLFGPSLWAGQDAVVNIHLTDGPEGQTLVEVKATKNRSGDAQKNLLKFLPDGVCAEYKPPKEK